MSAALAVAPQVLALAAMIGLAVLAGTVAVSRTLFAIAALTAAFGALASLAAVALGAPYAALAFALAGAGLWPLFLLGSVLLSARAARARRLRIIATPLAFVLIGAAVLWLARDVALAPPIAPMHAPAIGAAALWIGALAAIGGLGAFALLAFGERGGFERAP